MKISDRVGVQKNVSFPKGRKRRKKEKELFLVNTELRNTRKEITMKYLWILMWERLCMCVYVWFGGG